MCASAISFLPGSAAADTGDELDAARTRLDAAQSDLDQVTAAYSATEARLSVALDQVAQARRDIAHLERDLAATQRSLQARTVESFMSGGGGAIGTLLTSSSLSELADRVEFASAVAQGDADLANRIRSEEQQLTWARARFAAAAQAREIEAANLARQRDAMAAAVDRLTAIVDELKQKLAEEQRQQIGIDPQPNPSGAIQVCPVHGPNSFTDSFGDPRPGGRTHQGIDLIAAYGTPIVAVHAGDAVRAPSELGGNGVIVYHDGSADYTFYAHMSSYGAEGHVATGTVIGYVGATGDTDTNHLHFEYHPGGGAAVDPYRMLLAVC